MTGVQTCALPILDFFLIDDFGVKSMLMPWSDSVNSVNPVTRLPNLLNSANPDVPSCPLPPSTRFFPS